MRFVCINRRAVIRFADFRIFSKSRFAVLDFSGCSVCSSSAGSDSAVCFAADSAGFAVCSAAGFDSDFFAFFSPLKSVRKTP